MLARWLACSCLAVVAVSGSARGDVRARAGSRIAVALWAHLRTASAPSPAPASDAQPSWRHTLRTATHSEADDAEALERRWDELAARAEKRFGKLAIARWRMRVNPGQADTGGGTVGVTTRF